jgi:hypothetical protein
MRKHWEANVDGMVIKANTLKELAQKLEIKPSLIEGVYYRSRLADRIKIIKVIDNSPSSLLEIERGDFFVKFE